MALPDVELGLDPGVRAVDRAVAVVVVVAVGVLERQLRRMVRAELQPSGLEVEQESLGIEHLHDDPNRVAGLERRAVGSEEQGVARHLEPEELISRGARRRALVGHPYFPVRSEEHTSEPQSPCNLVCRLLLEKKKYNTHHA